MCLLAAEAALLNNQTSYARGLLTATMPNTSSVKVYELLRDTEKQDNNVTAAEDWGRKAQVADPNPTWICSHCQAETVSWAAKCSSCESIDTMRWETPMGGIAKVIGDDAGVPVTV